MRQRRTAPGAAERRPAEAAGLIVRVDRIASEIGRFETITDYAELIADFHGPFHDLRATDRASEPALNEDPTTAYPAGQALALRMRREVASGGLVYPSVRHPGGTCLVAFRPDVVQNLRHGGLWRLESQGARDPTVTRPTP